MLSQSIKFLAAGGFAAAANIGSRFIFSMFLSYKLSIFLSFLVGLSTGFLLMRNYVFVDSTNRTATQIFRFIAVNLAALFQTFVISIVLSNLILQFYDNVIIAEGVAHSIGVIFPVFTSYFAHKLFTFS